MRSSGTLNRITCQPRRKGVSAPKEGRVLFEESGDETGFIYAGMYLSAFAPHRTGRELIGGPLNLYNDLHHFAEFHSGLFFKQRIEAISDRALEDYLRAYNIGAIVAFHPQSVQRLLALRDRVRLDRRIGPFHLMRVEQPLTWLLEGEGRVQSFLGGIRVEEARGESLVLKYHWSPRLVADPPARVEPFPILADPIPFIRVVDPPAAFTLRLR